MSFISFGHSLVFLPHLELCPPTSRGSGIESDRQLRVFQHDGLDRLGRDLRSTDWARVVNAQPALCAIFANFMQLGSAAWKVEEFFKALRAEADGAILICGDSLPSPLNDIPVHFGEDCKRDSALPCGWCLLVNFAIPVFIVNVQTCQVRSKQKA